EFALLIGSFACRDQRGKHGGAAGDEWSARPPQVQRADVPMPDGFLAAGFRADGFDGDIVFDQAFVGVGHDAFSSVLVELVGAAVYNGTLMWALKEFRIFSIRL